MIFSRIKNLWRLSESRIEETKDGKEVLVISERKPKKRLAKILQDDPVEMFPEHSEKL